MKAFFSIIRIFGIFLIITISIADHILFINNRSYWACMGIAAALVLPMTVWELVLFRKKGR